jgi:hypothetical protein
VEQKRIFLELDMIYAGKVRAVSNSKCTHLVKNISVKTKLNSRDGKFSSLIFETLNKTLMSNSQKQVNFYFLCCTIDLDSTNSCNAINLVKNRDGVYFRHVLFS